jgi:hypothetical protein
MRRPLIAALAIVALAVLLGGTVFREQVAQAAQNLNVFVTNDASHPVPVHEQGTAQVNVSNSTPVRVDAGFETQLVFDQELQDGDRVTIPVAAYKTLHFDFDLTNGTCATSGASLLILEATHFLERGRIGADEACVGGFTGKTIEMPGRSLTLIVHALPGDTWRVVVFGRAN